VLTFDEARHEYRFSGAVVPHVTGVLKPLTDYGRVDPDKLEIARQKGVAVHSMVELDAKNELGDLPDWMVPVYDYWLQIKQQMGLEIIASERKVYHSTYGYAGTLDLQVFAHNTKLKGPGIIDVKRSFMAGQAIALQTAAYAAACDHESKVPADRIQWRAALRLREDMPPRLETYDNRNDINVFIACLTLHNWRKKHDRPE